VNGPADNDSDSLSDIQIEMVRGNMQRMSDAQLASAYEIYRTACRMETGRAPKRAKLQYFGEAWREQRRRDKLKPAE
jgi:hypothetical protein